MILQALHALADAENLVGDADYKRKAVHWLIHIDAKGRMLGLPQGTRTTPQAEEGSHRTPKPVAKRFLIPKPAPSRSGQKPPAEFLVDNASFVFGADFDDKGTDEEELRRRAADFRAQVERCAQEAGDEAMRAVLRFLEDIAGQRQAIGKPDQYKKGDRFTFVYAPDVDLLACQRPKVKRWWKKQREQQSGSGNVFCLVTGQPCSPTTKHPKLKNVPQRGAQGEIALLSFNKSAFWSYGWKYHSNAPVSREAAEACATALNRLLDPRPQNAKGEALPVRHVRLSGDTVVCFWSPKAKEQGFLDALPDLFAADPEQVANLYHALWRGRMPDIDDASAFYAVTLSGAQGRATLRDWLESTVSEVAEHLRQHFEDLAIVRSKPRDRELPPAVPLQTLLRSLAPPGKEAAIPPPLAAQVVRSALTGMPYPWNLLMRALERTRAEIGRATRARTPAKRWEALRARDARAALIKAVLNRRHRFRHGTLDKEVTEAMDPTNTNPGYLLGRLMAVIERMQQAALGEVGATVVDRFFSSASATPATAFPRLLKGFRHHASKAKDNDRSRGTAIWLERQADETMKGLQGFPAFLPLEQQGLFVLGYHHMRHWLWSSKEERGETEELPVGKGNAQASVS